jgi:hypothetical protein
MHYFATDGNWGGAEGLLIIDIDHWSDSMTEIISESTDSDRHFLAKHFMDKDCKFHPSVQMNCIVCGLSKGDKRD